MAIKLITSTYPSSFGVHQHIKQHLLLPLVNLFELVSVLHSVNYPVDIDLKIW
uniref:Uncharacterized protein n=1 Tax=Tetranychus urticae TaxID=32264 RepID=T1KEX0_TETUR